jgi:hypothetical protein
VVALEASVGGGVRSPVVGKAPPVGESLTKASTNPPDRSSSGTQSTVGPMTEQFCCAWVLVNGTSWGSAVSKPSGADDSVTQYEPGIAGWKTANPSSATIVARTGASAVSGS